MDLFILPYLASDNVVVTTASLTTSPAKQVSANNTKKPASDNNSTELEPTS